MSADASNNTLSLLEVVIDFQYNFFSHNTNALFAKYLLNLLSCTIQTHNPLIWKVPTVRW